MKSKYWKHINDELYEKLGHIKVKNQDNYHAVEAIIFKDGIIKLITTHGGLKTEGTRSDKGRTAEEWIALIKESKQLQTKYFG